MKYFLGKNREQTYLFPVSLDESLSNDNEVRLIDLFVDSLNISKFGFKVDFGENGRPAYHPADLLKLYIYGYMNKIRSSRDSGQVLLRLLNFSVTTQFKKALNKFVS